MDLPVRGRLGHEVPQWVDDQSFFLITICGVPRGSNQFCRENIGEALLETVAFYHHQFKWHCLLFLLMPDHAHGLLSFPRTPGMKQTITAWKSYNRRFNAIQWQRDFFDHRLRNRVSLEEKVSYVLQNPVRAGLCARPEEWPYVYRPQDRPRW
ncbi:MAG: transposase [Limisphaerales bacterium]